ncbi:MAG TPA: glycosyltransferase family 2 protein [Gammaproteobacteria bacterium]
METVFWVSIFMLLYTYAGYPLLVWLLGLLRPRIVLRRAQQPSVTIIIVTRNGERWIDAKLDNCLTLDYPHDQLHIVLVSDGSTDTTVARARAFRSPRVDIVECSAHRGKAACLNDAVRHARGDILVFTDVRQRLDAQAVRHLVMNFADETVGAASGELMLGADGAGFAGGMDLYWRYEKWLRINEARFSSSIGVTGAIYAMRAECFRPIPANAVLDDVLIPMNVVLDGKRVVFDRSAVAHDVPSASPARERQRKVRTIAGNYQLVQLRPDLLDPRRNPVWLQFLSHKLLRLVVPFFLVAALGANLVLARESTLYQLLLVAQLAMYACALLGTLLPAAQRLRLVRVPTTFVLLNWFAVLGLVSFARHGREQPW